MVKVVIKLAVGLALILAIIMFVSSSFLPIEDLKECRAAGNCAKVDAIVVVSGGKTVDRVEQGARLFQEGLAEKMVLSGAAADPESISDAEFMRSVAMENGVPEDAIVLDEKAKNTQENAANTAEIIKDEEWKSVILVTSPYHSRRVYLEFQAALKGAGVDIYSSYVEESGGFPWWAQPKGVVHSVREWGGIVLFHLRG